MNKIFKVIWNHATQSWVVVSELQKAKGKSKTKSACLQTIAISAALAGSTLISGQAMAAVAIGSTSGNTISATGATVGTDSIAIGSNARGTGAGSVAIGTFANATGLNSYAAGREASALGGGSTAIGYQADATANNSVAIGEEAFANGTNSYAMGSRANATGSNSIAIGSQANTTANRAIALGFNANAIATTTIAIGYQANARGGYAQALGANSTASAIGSNAIGRDVTASGVNATSIGTNSNATAESAVAMGVLANASAQNANALGLSSNASGLSSFAMGTRANASAESTYAIGTDAVANNTKSIAIGSESKSSGDKSISIGDRANATNTHSFAMGGSSLSSGLNSLAIGVNTKATGNYSLAQGNAAIASAEQSQAMGADANASALYAIALGSKAAASGQQSFAGGREAVASGDSSVAQGYKANASAINSIAIGNSALSSGASAISTGVNSKASGSSAIATGNNANATGNDSIATGTNAIASQSNAIASGNGAEATNFHAVAVGAGSVASGTSSIALGQNVRSSSSNTVAIGTSSNVTAVSGVAIGQNSKVESNNALALGVGSTVAAGFERSVALGAYSTVSAAVKTNTASIGSVTYSGFAGNNPEVGDVVSVGSADRKRQIQNVAAGQITATSTDAINGSQLYAIIDQTKNYFHVNNGTNANTGDATTNLGRVTDAAGATANGAIAAGVNAQVGTAATNAVALGKDAKVLNTSGNSIAMGNTAKVDASASAVAIGMNTSVTSGAVNSIAMGTNANATVGQSQIVMGTNAKGSNNYVIAMGINANASRENAIAIGNGTTAAGYNSVALGNKAGVTTTASDAVAIGNSANASLAGSVALGNASTTSAAVATPNHAFNGITYNFAGGAPAAGDVVSVGGATKRQIQNVAAGRISDTSTDAINGSQLYSVITQSAWQLQANGAAVGDVNFGDKVNFKSSDGTVVVTPINETGGVSTLNLAVKQGLGISVDANGGLTVDTTRLDQSAATMRFGTPRGQQDKFVKASNLAGYLNNVGFKLSGGEQGGSFDNQTVDEAERRILTGDVLNMDAGPGIKITQVNKGYEFALDTTELGTNVGYAGNKAIETTDAAAIATVKSVAEAINHAGFTLKTSANGGDKLGGTDEVINPADVVEMIAGKNLTVKQDAAGKITYATKDDVTFNSVTSNTVAVNAGGNLTVGAGSTVNMGNNVITNVANGTAPNDAVNVSQLNSAREVVKAGTNVVVTETTNTTTGAKEFKVDAKDTTATHAAASAEFLTVSAAQDKGGNVNNFETALTTRAMDALKAAETALQSFTTSVNGTQVELINKDNRDVNFVNGAATTAKADGQNITFDVNVDNDTIVIGTDGKLKATFQAPETTALEVEDNKVKTPDTTEGAKLVNATEVANAINKSGFTLTTTQSDGESVSPSDEVVNPGDKVTVDAGKNIKLTQTAGKISVATKDDVTFNSVTSNTVAVNTGGSLTVGAGSTVNMGNNVITNVANGTAPNDAVNVSQLNSAREVVKAGTNVVVTETTNTTTGAKEFKVDAKDTTATHAAASAEFLTVSAAQDKGGNVNNFETALTTRAMDALKAAETALQSFTTSVNGNQVEVIDKNNRDVNFVNGAATTAKADGQNITFDVNVDNDTIVIGTDGKLKATFQAPETTALVVEDNKVKTPDTTEGAKLVNATEVANAINKSGFTLTTTQSDGESVSPSDEVVNPGDKVTVDAGKNIKLTQTAGKISVATKDDVTFNSVTSNTVAVNAGGNLTVGAGSTVNMGNNVITNVANGTAPNDAVNVSQLNSAREVVKAGTNVVVTETTNTTTGAKEFKVDAKDTTATHAAASAEFLTVSAAQDKGGNVNNFETALTTRAMDALKAAETALQSFTTSVNGTQVELINKDNRDVNFVNGAATTAKADGQNITFDVNVDNDTIVIGTDGKLKATFQAPETTALEVEDNKVKTPDTTEGAKLVNATEVANAINKSGFTLTTTQSDGESVSPSDEVVNPGDKVTVDAGKNIKLTQTAGKISVATKDDVTFNSVTSNTVAVNTGGSLTVGAGSTVNMGNNVITNVANGTAPNDAVNVSQLNSAREVVKAGTNVVVTETTNTTTGAKEFKVDAKDTTATHAAASAEFLTVSAAQDKGGNVNNFETALTTRAMDALKAAETALQSFTTSVNGNQVEVIDKNNRDVNFVNGAATTAKADGQNITFDVNVDNDTIVIGTDGKLKATFQAPETTALVVEDNKVKTPDTTEGAKLVNATEVANAINKSGFTLTTTQSDGESVSPSDEVVNPGDKVTVDAGKNIKLTQTAGKISVATKDDVTFNSVTSNTVAVNTGGSLTVGAGSTVNMGNNVITNVANGTAPNDAVNVSQLNSAREVVKAGTNVVVTETTNTTTGAKEFKVDAKDTTATHAAASAEFLTVSAAQDKGGNVNNFETALTTRAMDALKAAETALQSFTTSVNGTQVELINKNNRDVNFVNGAATTAKADGQNITFDVNVDNDTIVIGTDGKLKATFQAPETTALEVEDNKVKTPDTTEGAKLVNATEVANAINKSGFTLTTTQSDGESVSPSDEVVNPGDKVTVDAGKNIKLTQTAGKISVATKDDVTFNSVTSNTVAVNTGGSLTVGAGSTVNMGNNVITNVANGTAPNDAVNVSQLNSAREVVKAGTNVVVTETTNTTTGAKEFKVDAKDTTATHAAASAEFLTVSAAQDKGGNVNNFETALTTRAMDALKAAETALQSFTTSVNGNQVEVIDKNNRDVNFVNGAATTAKADGQNITFDVNVDNDTIVIGTDGKLKATFQAPETTALVVEDNKVKTPDTTEGAKLVNATEVANAINKSGFTLTTTQSDGESVSPSDEVVNPGDKVTVDAGKNIKLTQTAGKISVATKDDVTFNSVTSNTVAVNAGGNLTVGAGSTIDMGNNQITNVASGGDVNTNAANIGDVKKAKTEVKAGTNIVEVKKTTGAKEFKVDAKDTTATHAAASAEFLTVSAAQDKGGNVNNFETALTTRAMDALKAAETALQSFTTSVNGTQVEVIDKNNRDVNFVSGKGTVARADGQNITFDIDAGTIAVDNKGNVTTPTDDNKVATTKTVAEAIKNSGFNVKSGGAKAAGDDATSTLINPGEEVEFAAGKNLKVKRQGNVFTYETADEVTFDKVTVGPVVIDNTTGINAGGTQIKGVAAGTDGTDAVNVSQLNDKLASSKWTLQTSQDNAGVTKVGDINADDVVIIDGKGPIKVTNTVENATGENKVHIALETQAVKVENGKVVTDGNSKTGDTVNNAPNLNAISTVGDVINAVNNVSWSIHQNADAKTNDVKAGNEVHFVDSDSLTASVTKDGDTKTNVTFDVKKTTLTNDANNGTVTAGNANHFATAGDVAQAVNNAGFIAKASKSDGDATGEEDELIKTGQTVTFDAGKNIKITQTDGKFSFATKDDVVFNSVKVGPVTINNNGIDAGNKTITNVANGTAPNDAVNVSQLEAAKAAATTKVDGTQGVKVDPTVNNDGSTTYTVSAKTDGTTVTVDASGNITAVTSGLTNNTNGTVTTPAAPNALVTAQTVANAINNAGFNLQANGDTASLVKTGDTVQFLDGDNIEITRTGNDIKVATKKDVTFDSVKAGPVTINSNGIDAGNKAITNVANGTAPNDAVNVSQLEAAKAAATTKVDGNRGVKVDPTLNNDGSTTYTVSAKTDGTTVTVDASGNITAVTSGLTNNTNGTVTTPAAPNALVTAQTVANAINNAGFNLQANGDTASLVKTGDTVQFLDGDNIEITRTGNDIKVATKKDVTFDSVKAGPVTINSNGIDAGNKAITNVAAGVNATDAVNVSQLNTAVADLKEVVTSSDESINVTETIDAATNAKIFDVTVANTNLNVSNNGDISPVPDADKKKFVNAGDLATALNSTGFTLKTSANGGEKVSGADELINSGEVIDLAAGKNLTVKQDANGKVTYATSENVTFTTMNSTTVVVGNPQDPANSTKLTSGSNGLDVGGDKISNVANGDISAGSTQVINGSQLHNYTKVNGNNIGTDPSGAINIVNGNGTTVTSTKPGEVKVNVNSSDLTVADNGTINVQDPNGFVNATTVAKAVNQASWSIGSGEVDNGKSTYTANADSKVKAGETMKVNAGRNVEISGSGKDLNIAVSKNPEFDKVKVGEGKDATTISSDKDGMKVAKADGSPQRITNVAAGRPNVDTDAVNVGQLKGVVNQLDRKINRNNRDLRAGIAGANAAAGLPQVYIPGKSMVAAAAGTFKGESAVAVGYSRSSDNGKVILKLQGNANTRGDLGGSVGVGYQW